MAGRLARPGRQPRSRDLDEGAGQLDARLRRASCCSAWACEASRLGTQLVEQVADALEVRGRLEQVGLGLAPAALVLADAGRLLEQRAPLLGPQGERLVDHALADEEERVVGDVRVVEQVDEVAQPDPLAVEEVLVLARPVEPARQLHLAEVDAAAGGRRCRSGG